MIPIELTSTKCRFEFKHYNSSFVVEKSWQPKSRTRSVWKFSVTNPSIDIQARRPREKLRAFFDNQLSPVAKEPSFGLSCFPDDFTFVLFFFFFFSSFTLHLLALSRARLYLHPPHSMEVCLQVTSSCELIGRQRNYIWENRFIRNSSKILFVGNFYLNFTSVIKKMWERWIFCVM